MPIKLEGERYATEMLDKGSTIWFWTVQRLPQHPKVPEKSEFTNKALKGKDLSKTGGGGWWHWRADMDSHEQMSWDCQLSRGRAVARTPAGLLYIPGRKKTSGTAKWRPGFPEDEDVVFWIGAWWFEYLFVGVWEMEGAILRFQIDSYLEDHPS